jgi:hypothetical protein
MRVVVVRFRFDSSSDFTSTLQTIYCESLIESLATASSDPWATCNVTGVVDSSRRLTEGWRQGRHLLSAAIDVLYTLLVLGR